MVRLIDYISRSEARAAIAAARDKRIADKPYGWEWEYNGFNAAILALPMSTEDLVPVVRCGECIHRDPEDKKCDCGHGILWQLPREDDWFCADGERKDGDHNG